MSDTPSPPPAAAFRAASRPRDLALAVALLGVTGIVFWPVIRWVATQTFAREQLKQSFVIVVMAGLWIAWERRGSLRPVLQLTNASLAWLLSAYACVAGALLLKSPLLVLAGLVAAAGGAVHFSFGSSAVRRTLPLLGAFALLLLFVLLFPVLDWPLRKMAGIESARLLQALGLGSQLFVSLKPEPQLTLAANGGHFLVATECNGFGLITSSLLLGAICMLYRRAAWWKYPGLLALCVATGFVFNLLRIATIIVLAPRFPGRYDWLHEAAGLAALYSGLGLVWLLTGWRRKRAAA